MTHAEAISQRPRIGFLGVGWIGRHRLEALRDSGVSVVGLADPCAETLDMARALAPGARCTDCLDSLLELDLDGIAIATPSAAHAEQAVVALDRGLAVFCQKPLGRSAAEVERVIEAARAANRPLGVDLSYRYTRAMQQIAEVIRSGQIGDISAVDLTFHNAYGPDKPWFYQRSLAGGGCLIDLGIHLVDLALWCLDFPDASVLSSRMLCQGRPLGADSDQVEDYATVQLELATGAVMRLACSWRLPAGRDAVIEASFYGTKGGACMRNVNGSFYDFVAERYDGTHTQVLSEPPDAWGGRAAVAWSEQLRAGAGFGSDSAQMVQVARVLDAIYEATQTPAPSSHRPVRRSAEDHRSAGAPGTRNGHPAP